jgi:peptide deformylase
MSEKIKRSHLEAIPPESSALNELSDSIPQEHIASLETQWLIDEMLSFANGLQGDKKRRTMVGLAAPQIGANKRVIVVDVNNTGTGIEETTDLRVFLNPCITKRSNKTEIGREGCFSAGNVCGIVDRATGITVEAVDRNGEVVREDYNGFTARIFQHEIDHLDGVRFPDRINDDTRLHWVEPDQFGDYRERWRSWDVLCRREIWEAIKSGK